jgi:serine/threonine protein phosphatase PrpC
MARAPPAVLGVLAAVVGAGGWIAANLGALTDWIAAKVVDLLTWAADELNRYTATGATILWVVATLITASIPVRSVLHRQRMLRDLHGRVTRPRLDAAFSGVGYAVVSIGNRVLQLNAAAWPSWVGPLVSGIAGTGVSALQRKSIGATRFWGAIVAGLTSLATLAWLPTITTFPAEWSDYLHDGLWFVGVLAQSGWLGDYGVYWIGLLLRKVTERLQRWLDRKANEISMRPGLVVATQRLVGWLLGEVTKRWLNALSLTKPDYRMTLLRTPDAALTALIIYFVVRPMPGLPENVVTQAIRVGLAVVLAVVQWKARNRLERRRNAQGTVSDRPQFTRERPIAFHRVQSRIELVRERLNGFLQRLGMPVPNPTTDLDKPFAAAVVAELRAVLDQRLPDPADIEEMAALNGKDFPGLAAKGRQLHELWVDRHRQHRRAERVALMLMASRRTSIGGAADRLRMFGKDPAWRLAQFVKWMLDALRDPAMVDLLLSAEDRKELGLPESTRGVLALLPGDWERVLSDELARRHELRMTFLQRYIDLLEEWRAWLVAQRPADKAEIARVDTRIKHERGRLERERRRDTDLPALVAAHDLLGGRRRSVRNALSMAKAQLRAAKPGGQAAKLLEKQVDRLELQAAARALVQAKVSLLDEVEIHAYERMYWREQIDAVAQRPERIPRESLLAVLLFVANRTHPITAAGVAAELGDGVDRQAQLTMLAEIGAITVTQAGGYTAYAQLAAGWAHAHPRLRHAFLTNPALLLLSKSEWDAPPPGPFDPLLRTYIDVAATGQRDAAAHGVARLVEILVGVQRAVFRHHTPGAWDDWQRFRHRRDGRRYERRHPETQLDSSPSPTAPLEPVNPPMTFAEAEQKMRTALKVAEAAMRDVRRAELELRPFIAGPNAPPAGDIDPVTLSEEHRAARERLDAAADERATAFHDLAKVVEQVERDFPKPAARPMPLIVLLERAKALEAVGPGAAADPVPPVVALWRAATELRDARKVLGKAVERGEAVGDARADADYRNAQAQAGIALSHFAMVRERARDEKATDQWWPRLVERFAERQVRKILALAPQLAADAVVSVSGTAGTVHEWITPVSDDPSSRGAPVFEGVVPTPGPGAGVALYNARGAGRRVLQDVVGVRVDPRTGVIIVAIADGLSSGSRSERAARVAVEAVLGVVREEMTAGRTPGEAMNKAFHVAGAKVRALAAPAERTPPSTTLAAVVVEPLAHGRARVTWTHLGDSRISVIKADGEIEELTSDHTRAVEDGVTDSTAGWLTAWLGADASFRAHDVRTDTISGPAGVLLTTDGLHGAFRTAQQLRTAAGARAHLEPAHLVDRLQRAIGARADDASGIAVPINGPGLRPPVRRRAV